MIFKEENIMLILSRVCADFHDKTGAVIHRVTQANRLTFHEAPEAIREDPLFDMLIRECSLEAGVTSLQKKALEADPLHGADASGRTARHPKAAAKPSGAASRKEEKIDE